MTPDRSAARAFLAALCGDTTVTLQTFDDDKGRKDPALARIFHGLEALDACTELNARGAGVFVCVNQTDGRGRSSANIVAPRAIFVDFDATDPPRGIGALPPSAVVQSKNGKHVYWFLHPDQDLNTWSKTQRAMIEHLGSDPACKDAARVMRIPGFAHRKADPFLVTLQSLEPHRYTLDEIATAYGLELEKKRHTPKPAQIDRHHEDERLRRCAAFLEKVEGAVEGQGGWSHTNGVCGVGGDFGLEPDEYWPLLLQWNASCSPPWEEDELRRKLEAVHQLRTEPFGYRLDERREREPVRTIVVEHTGPQDVPPIGQPEPPPPPIPPPTDDDAPLEVSEDPPDDNVIDGPPPPPPDAPRQPSNDPEDLILSKSKPLQSARKLLRRRFWNCSSRTIHRFHESFYEWSGRCYQKRSKEHINAVVYDFTDRCKRKSFRATPDGGQRALLLPFDPDARSVSEIVKALRSVSFLPDDIVPPAWLDPRDKPPADEIAACANGLLHIPTGKLLPPTASFFSFNALGFAYDANAKAPETWLRFLDQLWPDDRPSQRLLQQWFGYCLTSDTRYQKALMLVGPRRSGKGTISKTLQALLGDENVANPTMTGLTKNFGLQGLIGKTLAVIPDARFRRNDEAAVLETILSITGEDPLQVDRKFHDPIQVRFGTRLMVLTNEIPSVLDPSGAFSSRFMMLRLDQSFLGREDRMLAQKLRPELPGILNWAIAGWRDLHEAGTFVAPPTSRQLTEKFEDLTSPTYAFVRDILIEDPGSHCSLDQLWGLWKKWCEEEGRKPGTRQMLGKNLSAALPHLDTTRPRIRGSQLRETIYHGIAIRQ